MAERMKKVEDGRKEGVQITERRRGGVEEVTSWSVKCEGRMERGRAAATLTVTSERIGPSADVTCTCIYTHVHYYTCE